MKRTLIIGGSVLVGAVGLFFVGRTIIRKINAKKGKERAEKLKQELGQTQTQQQQTEQQASSSYKPASHIKLLEGYILGGNVMYYPDEINGLINSLTDAKVKKLADAWKSKHKRTLYKDLDDEWDSCGFFSNCYETAMNRLKSLGKM
jgi:cell division protein YceG involved in septum cleavage